MHRPLALALLTALAGAPAALPAQAFTPELVAGIAVPTGGLGEHRSAGPLLGAAVLIAGPQNVLRWRLAAEITRWEGDDATGYSWRGSDMRVLTLGIGAVLGPRRVRPSPYVTLGAAAYFMDASVGTNPYGASPGVFVGAGVRGRIRHMELRAELGRHVILSDYGTREYEWGAYVPLSVRVAF